MDLNQNPTSPNQPSVSPQNASSPKPIQPILPSQKDETNTWMNPLLVIFAICALVLIGVILWLLLFQRKAIPLPQALVHINVVTPTPKPLETLSGMITFEGYFPPNAYIAIAERSQKGESYRDVVSGLIPSNGQVAWSWNSARGGTNYDIKATLKVQGKVIQSSEVANVSAPAGSVGLTIVSDQNPPQPTTTTINGSVQADGYFPAGTTVTILARQDGTIPFNTIAKGVALSTNNIANFTWNNATVGVTYNIKAELVDGSGNSISTPVEKTVTAPSSGLTFNVSSTANPPQPTTTGVSGTIIINGTIPANSYITLAYQPTGGSTFTQVASNIAATNGVSWSWGGAQAGSQYDMQAYLWSNGKPYAASNIVTVTAPSLNDVLTINAQQQLAAPAAGTLNVSCNSQQNSLFQATINYNTNGSINNAQTYNIIVVSASQGNQVVNTSINPPNPGNAQSLTTTYLFTPGATYYAQYAYAVSGNNFSSLSPAVQFSCQ